MHKSNRICFIIAHKYYRCYTSYLHYYVAQIKRFYSDALVVIVDNNSVHAEDILPTVAVMGGVTVLSNGTDSKFEIGAYQVALDYLGKRNLLSSFTHFVFSQDNFIIKNKFDFDNLVKDGIEACPLVSSPNDWEKKDVWFDILSRLNMLDDHCDFTELCWCNSFIVSSKVVKKLHSVLKDIKVLTRHESEASERYLGRVLYELNGYYLYSIDGHICSLAYNCHTVDPTQAIPHYFCKASQQKNENTRDV